MKTYLILFICWINASTSIGQIFTLAGGQTGFTILPEGIIGKYPFLSDVTNISLGEYALHKNTTGTKNIAIGNLSMNNNTSGYQLTGVGIQALSGNTTGILNSAFGAGASSHEKTSNENTAFGFSALSYNISLSRNVAIGHNALREQAYNGENASDNVAVGQNALMNNNPTDITNGLKNIAIGSNALYLNQTGARNIGLSTSAAYSLVTGNDNLALGINALLANTAGSQNTAIGHGALNDVLGSGNVGIGIDAGANETGDNKLYIAVIDDNIPLIGGDFTAKKVGIARDMVSTANPNDFKNRTETLQVEGEAFKTLGTGSWIFSSDLRLKKNISSLNSQEMLQKVVQMQGVNYEMRDEKQPGIQYGFIAQDLQRIFPSKIKENLSGYLSADYGSYDPMLVEAIKALNKKLTHLKKDKFELEAAFTALDTEFIKLLNKVEELELEKNQITIQNQTTKE